MQLGSFKVNTHSSSIATAHPKPVLGEAVEPAGSIVNTCVQVVTELVLKMYTDPTLPRSPLAPTAITPLEFTSTDQPKSELRLGIGEYLVSDAVNESESSDALW
jgi:hypothetical protein